MEDYFRQILIEDLKVETIWSLVLLLILILGAIQMYKSWKANRKKAESIFLFIVAILGSVFLIVTKVDCTVNTIRDINDGTYVEIHGRYQMDNNMYKHSDRWCVVMFPDNEPNDLHRFIMPSTSEWFRRGFERESFPAGDGVGTLVYAEHSKIAVMFIPNPGTTVVENRWYK